MITSVDARDDWIRSQVRRLVNYDLPGRPVIFHDTSNFMGIDRDHIVELEGKLFLVRCNEREGRFGLDDEPKFWVKRALSLDTEQVRILKLVFLEEFKVRVGTFEVRCVRSAEKEGRVLDLVRGHPNFMQGRVARDSRGNLVRIIEYIFGTNLLNHLASMNMPHEPYFRALFPQVLAKTMECLVGIRSLHEAGLCHGDIRNDHILIDRESGDFRWIDFDLTQPSAAFDVWSVGNVLHYIVAKGFVTFREVLQERPELLGHLSDDDASVFFPHRVMSLGKVHPYLPRKLSHVLARFSVGREGCYESVAQILEDLGDCATSQGWPVPSRTPGRCDGPTRGSGG